MPGALLPLFYGGVGTSAPPPVVADVNLREAIGEALAANPAIVAIVGPRIWGGHRRPQLSALPCVTYRVESNIPGQILRGPDGTSVARVEIRGSALRLAEAAHICLALRPMFDGFDGTLGTTSTVLVRWSKKQDETDLDPDQLDDGSDRRVYRVQSIYRFDYYVRIPTF